MHSSSLRGGDFEIQVHGKAVDHAAFFEGFTRTRRLGLWAPDPIAAGGAGNLIFAHLTAFYGCYRSVGSEFFAHPDFFAFQDVDPPANFGMFDFWPEHKSVRVGPTPDERLAAVTDRAINILLVPEPGRGDHERQTDDAARRAGKGPDHSAQFPESTASLRASALRNIDTCYQYRFDGHVEDADVLIRCPKDPIGVWIQQVLDSIDTPDAADQRSQWDSRIGGDGWFEQSYRRISVPQALSSL